MEFQTKIAVELWRLEPCSRTVQFDVWGRCTLMIMDVLMLLGLLGRSHWMLTCFRCPHHILVMVLVAARSMENEQQRWQWIEILEQEARQSKNIRYHIFDHGISPLKVLSSICSATSGIHFDQKIINCPAEPWFRDRLASMEGDGWGGGLWWLAWWCGECPSQETGWWFQTKCFQAFTPQDGTWFMYTVLSSLSP